MQFPTLVLAFVLAATTASASAQSSAGGGSLSLAEAMRLAETASTAVRSKEAQLAAAEGARLEAASPFFRNPELSVEKTRRQSAVADSRASEWTAGIAQPIEIGGQQSRRREAAAASLDALRAEIDDSRRRARSDAASRFFAVLAAQRRLLVEQRSLDLFDRAAQAVAKRRSAGEDTRLDANVALIEAERARNAVARAREQILEARGELATLLQLPAANLTEVVGEIGVPPVDRLPYGLDQMQSSAQTLPRQRALTARLDAAKARVALARAGRLPDLTVGVNVGREGSSVARERVTALVLRMPLPIFNRNDAAIGEALTAATQAEVDRDSGMRNALAQVRGLWSKLESQRERVERLQRTMLAAATDNQQLAAKSRQAGQIGLLEQLIINRQALDAERDLIEALADYHTTRIELENAAGWSQEGTAR
ncbi:MAG: TolC family protein [Burkholderiales bacterium]|nr:TolC family protein [Burkholderiales bacterium]